MPSVQTRVAVIGAGIAGLTAARDLARLGCHVTLFEKSERCGGRIQSVELFDQKVDIGAEAFATRNDSVLELITELGLEEALVAPDPSGSWLVYADRKSAPMPRSGALGVPTAPLAPDARRILGLRGALRAACEPLIPRSVGRKGSFGELVRRRLGHRVLNHLVRPVALGVYSRDPEDIAISAVPGLSTALAGGASLLSAATQLRASQRAAGGAIATLREGMTSLTAALEEELDALGAHTLLGATVVRIARRDDQWQVHSARGMSTVDGVILAVPEREAYELLDVSLSPTPPQQVEVIALALDEPLLTPAPRGTGALVCSRTADAADPTDAPHSAARRTPRRASKSPSRHQSVEAPIAAKALTHVTAKWPHKRAHYRDSQHIIRLSYGREATPPLTQGLDDDAATRLALSDAARIFDVPLRPESVRGMSRQRWHNAAPARELPQLPTRIQLAGDWVHGTGLASVVPGARQSARQLAEQLNLATAPHSGQIATPTSASQGALPG